MPEGIAVARKKRVQKSKTWSPITDRDIFITPSLLRHFSSFGHFLLLRRHFRERELPPIFDVVPSPASMNR
jgi:hypothetical protein